MWAKTAIMACLRSTYPAFSLRGIVTLLYKTTAPEVKMFPCGKKLRVKLSNVGNNIFMSFLFKISHLFTRSTLSGRVMTLISFTG